ncbi:MAG: hypothetical protein OEO79_09225 [Gemmatimonadota bacterium]|nr:hypothetical protein [Gemmatimonadota bacterium]
MGLTAGVALLAVQVALASPTATDFVTPGLTGTPTTLRVGPQRPDLVRYNRVEALSLGARAQARPRTPLGPLSLTGTVRWGLGDRHLNGRLGAAHETLGRRIVVSGYHELAAIDERARHFGVANSLMALVVGQDDGDYYRRSGGSAEWAPPTARPRTYRLRAYAEYHRDVDKRTDVQLPELWDEQASFRPNIDADEGWEYGMSVELGPRWGTDLTQTRAGVHIFGQWAVGDAEYARFSLGGEVTLELPARLSLSLEAQSGTSWGSPSAQRLWYIGGPLTLRGFDPRAAGGESFGRGRAELERSFSFGRLVVFSDAGWAGDRTDIDLDESLRSAGVGLALIDGILRVDGAWRLDDSRRFRLDVYLDQIL